jgi:hypothetical protein
MQSRVLSLHRSSDVTGNSIAFGLSVRMKRQPQFCGSGVYSSAWVRSFSSQCEIKGVNETGRYC